MSARTVTVDRSESVAWQSLIIAGIVSFVAALIANLIIRWIAMQTFEVSSRFEALQSAFPTVLVTFLYSLGALITYAIVRHVSERPKRTFLIVAAIAFVLSFIPVALLRSEPGYSGTAIGILAAMHIVSALIIVPTLLRIGRPG